MKITWLGDHTDQSGGPRINVWNGIKFPINEPVEVNDVQMIAKAKVHPQYKLEERRHVEIKEEGKEEQVKEEGKKDYDYRQVEKKDYVPIKKKVRKKKAGAASPPAVPDADP